MSHVLLFISVTWDVYRLSLQYKSTCNTRGNLAFFYHVSAAMSFLAYFITVYTTGTFRSEYFLCPRQARLLGGVIFSTCPFVHPFVATSSVTKLWTRKHMNRIWCQLAQVVQGAKTWNGQRWGQEVKGQGHTKPKIDLEAWRRHHSRPILVK